MELQNKVESVEQDNNKEGSTNVTGFEILLLEKNCRENISKKKSEIKTTNVIDKKGRIKSNRKVSKTETKRKSKRLGSVSKKQKLALVDFIELHPELLKPRTGKCLTNIYSATLWKNGARILNSIPGACKPWKSWRKCWQDIKNDINLKLKHKKRRAGAESNNFSKIDEKIFNLMYNSTSTKLTDVHDSLVNLKIPLNDFDDISQSTIKSQLPENETNDNIKREQSDNECSVEIWETSTLDVIEATQPQILLDNNTNQKLSNERFEINTSDVVDKSVQSDPKTSKIETKKKKKPLDRVSKKQKVALVDFIELHPELLKSRTGRCVSNIYYAKLWKDEARRLNGIAGACKPWQSWRKCWQAIKNDINIKLRNKNRLVSAESNIFSEVDEKIINIMYNCTSDEFTDVTNRYVNLDIPLNDFHDISQATIKSQITENVINDNVKRERSVSECSVEMLDSSSLHVIEAHEPQKGKQNETANNFTQTVNTSYQISNEEIIVKENYYTKKLELLERLVMAKEKSNEFKERIALALEKQPWQIDKNVSLKIE